MSFLARGASAALAIVLAGALWLPNVHRLYAGLGETYRGREGIAPRARALAEDQLAAWSARRTEDTRIAAMRATNPEWDFMARTYLALALADLALRSPPEEARFLGALDDLIDDTLERERRDGQRVFLLSYADARSFVDARGRSLFVDGEIALMLGVRQLVRPRDGYAPLLRERARQIERSMRAGPVRSGESYPDECWTFCNTTALAALRVADAIDPADAESHDALVRDWIDLAKRRLVDADSGLLVSSYSYSGEVKDGPEGSSIWMTARNLLLLDEPFARDQYARARRALGDALFGFAYSREWPRAKGGAIDVDSGPIVPWLEASPGASGMALLGASAFDDGEWFEGLASSLELAAFPEERGGKLRFAASNAVGDAVLLSASAFGPVWERVRRARAQAAR